MTDEELEVLYDPLTRHAEYQRGQTVIYRTDGRRKIGEIMWITAPTPDHPTEYWIDGLTCIYQNDIEGIDEQSDTAILTHCPYCHTTHAAEGIEWCRQRYRK